MLPFSALEALTARRMILGYLRVTPPSSKRRFNYYHLKSMYIYVYIFYIAIWFLEGPKMAVKWFWEKSG